MKANFITAVGLIVLNMIILIIERPAGFEGWRLYGAMAAMLLISSISPIVGIALLLPITLLNVLFNTTKIFKLRR